MPVDVSREVERCALLVAHRLSMGARGEFLCLALGDKAFLAAPPQDHVMILPQASARCERDGRTTRQNVHPLDGLLNKRPFCLRSRPAVFAVEIIEHDDILCPRCESGIKRHRRLEDDPQL